MKKSIFYFFTKTYGISSFLAFKMCSFINVSPKKNTNEISDLKRKQALTKFAGSNQERIAINKLIFYDTINHIKGFKLRCQLPINGQRNKTNAKTAKKNARALLNLIKRTP